MAEPGRPRSLTPTTHPRLLVPGLRLNFRKKANSGRRPPSFYCRFRRSDGGEQVDGAVQQTVAPSLLEPSVIRFGKAMERLQRNLENHIVSGRRGLVSDRAALRVPERPRGPCPSLPKSSPPRAVIVRCVSLTGWTMLPDTV
jgi:hypothetical protein